MADSSFDDFVQAVEAQLADASVLFTEGATGKLAGRRDQKRRISFERASGTVKFSSANVPLSVRNVTRHGRFARNERLKVTLAAENEDTLDQLFDNLINAIFDIMGPNAFEAENAYEWGGQDSKGGAHTVRQPILVFELIIKLRVAPPVPLSVVIDDTSLAFEIGDP